MALFRIRKGSWIAPFMQGVLFLLVFFAVLLGLNRLNRVETWAGEGTLPTPAERDVIGIVMRTERGNVDELIIPPTEEGMALAVASTGEVKLLLDGEELAAFDEADYFSRLLIVPIPATGGVLTWQRNGTAQPRIILGSMEAIQHYRDLFLCINLFLIGFQAFSLVYAGFLYCKKRTEGYLLDVALLAAGSLLLSLFTCGIAILPVSRSAYRIVQLPLHIYIRLMALRCCGNILKIKLKWLRASFSYVTQGIVGAILWLLHAGAQTQLQTKLMDALPWLGLIYIGYAALHQKRSLSAVTAGYASLMAVIVLYRMTLMPSSGLLSVYVYVLQYGYAMFLLACLLVAGVHFSEKFVEAEQLSDELEEKVRLRTLALEQANAQVRSEQEQRSQAMINLLHDLRTPVFNAQGCLDIMEAEGAEGEAFHLMRKRMDEMGRLVEDLFLIAKLEQDKVSFVMEDIRLDVVCASAAEGLLPQANKQGIGVCCKLDAPVVVCADAFRMKQVIDNLAYNALRYAPAGSVITLLLQKSDGSAVLSICDQGQGIATEDLPRVFSRYYHRGDHHSTGLGLSIAYELVTAMNGTISVASEVGNGTIFTVKLPLCDV